jgi:hypothetical protein
MAKKFFPVLLFLIKRRKKFLSLIILCAEWFCAFKYELTSTESEAKEPYFYLIFSNKITLVASMYIYPLI